MVHLVWCMCGMIWIVHCAVADQRILEQRFDVWSSHAAIATIAQLHLYGSLTATIVAFRESGEINREEERNKVPNSFTRENKFCYRLCRFMLTK